MQQDAAPQERLKIIGSLPDSEVPLAETAFLLSALSRPGLSLSRFETHLQKLAEDTGSSFANLLQAKGEDDTPQTRLDALREVLVEKYGYKGDLESGDDLQNADLSHVIDRRKGMAVTLAILYIAAARAQGWQADGLNIPGIFSVRLEKGGHRLMFSPFHDGKILQAADLRQSVKAALGDHAELSAHYYDPCSNRDILVSLQNHIKLRQIESEDYEGALKTVEAARLLAPAEYRLLLDEGVLCARTARRGRAVEALESYIGKAPEGRDRMEAEVLLRHLRAGSGAFPV